MRKISYNIDDVKLDNGFYFGQGVFETILIKDRPIMLVEHIERLNNSIKFMNLGNPIELQDVENFIQENNLKNIVLKIVITEKNIVYATRKINYTERDYIKGFSLKISSVLRNPTSNLTYIKSLNYIENIMELNKAKEEGYNEVLFLNIYGNIAECATSNIFMVKDGKVYTSKVSDGLLPGVVRQWVINNHNVIEKSITKEEVFNADEVFITNSIMGIMKVSSIDKVTYDSKVIEDIKKKYKEFLGG